MGHVRELNGDYLTVHHDSMRLFTAIPAQHQMRRYRYASR